MQEEDHAPALAVDDVVVDAPVVVDDQHDILFTFLVHHQQVEGVLLEHNFRHGVHFELSPLFGRETEALHAWLTLLQLFRLPLVYFPPLLVFGLIRIDFSEGVVVNHHSAGRSLLEGLFTAPAELDDVPGVLHLTHAGSQPVEVLPAGAERV